MGKVRKAAVVSRPAKAFATLCMFFGGLFPLFFAPGQTL
jgi:hypothetical protein